MIHLLLEARKNGLKHEEQAEIPDTGFATVGESELGKATETRKREITDEDITAQALIFLLAGFEAVATSMCFSIYELAVNSEVQTKLREEIDKAWSECKGKLTYESIAKMKYLDMVVSGKHVISYWFFTLLGVSWPLYFQR